MERLSDVRSLSARPPQLRKSFTQLIGPLSTVTGSTVVWNVPSDYWARIISVIATPITSSTAGIRQYVGAYFVGNLLAFTAVPLSQGIGPSQLGQITGVIDGQNMGQVGGDSEEVEGRVLGPAAAATIATLTLASEEWTVNWEVQLDGTVAAADENNFGLYVGATLVATSVNPPTAGGPYLQESQTIQVPFGGAALAVKAIGAGTATAGYTASFTVTPYGNITSYARLPDLVLQPGWQFGIETINGSGGDQIANTYLLVEQFPSDWASGTQEEEMVDLLRKILRQLGG